MANATAFFSVCYNTFMKRLLMFGFLAVSLLGLAHTTRAQSTGEAIKNFAADITVQADSSIRVEERLSYDFGTNQRRGIFRDIPVKYERNGSNFNVRISDVNVKRDSALPEPFTTTFQKNNLEIKIGDANSTITGIHDYTISYTVRRALNYFSDHDELYWNVTGNDWTIPIAVASATVHLPDGTTNPQTACFTGRTGSTGTDCTIKVADNTITYTTTTHFLGGGSGLTLVAGFTKGIVKPPTMWQNILDFLQDNKAVALPIVVLIFMFLLWYYRGRDVGAARTIVAQYEAPQDLTPIEAGTIVDEKVDDRDISAQIIFLAVSGYIKIERKESKSLGVFTSVDYELTKLKDPAAEEKPSVKDLLVMLFPDIPVRLVSSFKRSPSFLKSYRKYVADLSTALTEQGYFTANPRKVKFTFAMIGAVGMYIFGRIIGVDHPVLLFSVLASGIIIMIFGAFMSRKTAKGREMKEYMLGLKLYLGVAEKDRLEFHNAPEKNPAQFEKLLPYAIALGVEKKWAAQFEGIYNQSPSWYNDPAHNTFNALLLTNSLGDFSQKLHTAAPVGNAGPGGGSGLRGGGFSGGGFGGGGGGSW